MKQTKNLGLNLLEIADLLSPKPLNENAEKVDAALGGMAEKLLGRVMMASGSYYGDKSLSVTIQTPGFKPTFLLMRRVSYSNGSSTIQYLKSEIVLEGEESRFTGFTVWHGEDISVGYWYENGTERNSDGVEETAYSHRSADIRFTAADGSLTWSLSASDMTADIDHSPLVNNNGGSHYAWIAFGYKEGDG